MSNDPTAELWAQAIDEHVAGMSDSEFTALVERTRPKPVSAMSYRELRETSRESPSSRERNHGSRQRRRPHRRFTNNPPERRMTDGLHHTRPD
jgi:hypothetical protein